MPRIPDWRGAEIEVAKSSGGVLAVANVWDNVISTGVSPWPPSELIQKTYKSRQERAYREKNLAIVKARLGFYSDLQSLHSEDAITWSVFGPVSYATPSVRDSFVRQLLDSIGVPYKNSSRANVWLWRRLPHPDTLVSGGPEIDFGIRTGETLLLGEAKWLSAVGAGQGVRRDKNQLTLRREFCEKYGRRLFPTCKHFIILGVSMKGGMVTNSDTEVDGVAIHNRDTTWKDLTEVTAHPVVKELRAYLGWKIKNSKIKGQ